MSSEHSKPVRIHSDLAGNPLPSHVAMEVDHVTSRFTIEVTGMRELTESEIKELLQTRYKVDKIETRTVIVYGRKVG